MPGKPVPELGWPGTKNKASHRVYLTSAVRDLIADLGDGAGFAFASQRGNAVDNLSQAMQEISRVCSFDPAVTPHDLRRTCGSKITGRRHGLDAMDPSHFPVLAQLCRHCVASDRIAALIEVVAAKKQINISELTSLHSAQSSESAAIVRLSRQLRLTHQAVYRANNTGRLTPTIEHDAPWRREPWQRKEDRADE